MKRRAFTIVELMVVIAIIALLGSLLVMGLSKMSRSARINSSKVDLESMHSMFDEMNATSRLAVSPPDWLWRNLPPNPAPYPYATPAANFDFWKKPWLTPDPRGGVNPPIPDCLDAEPGAMTAENPIMRNGTRAILNTQLAMRVMLSYPVNKAAFARLPADRWMIPTWVKGSIPYTGADGILGTPADDPLDTVKTVCYAPNNCVQDLDKSVAPPVMKTYRCTVACDATVALEPYLDVGNLNWVPDNNPTPVLLDAWNNPLIFVPASGLINVYGNVSVSGGPVDTSVSPPVVRPDSSDTITALPNMPLAAPPVAVPSGGRFIPPIQSPDFRPFFVSAGPDGDLSTGDDNLYSFEK